MGSGGFEPPTSRLSGVRSNQAELRAPEGRLTYPRGGIVAVRRGCSHASRGRSGIMCRKKSSTGRHQTPSILRRASAADRGSPRPGVRGCVANLTRRCQKATKYEHARPSRAGGACEQSTNAPVAGLHRVASYPTETHIPRVESARRGGRDFDSATRCGRCPAIH